MRENMTTSLKTTTFLLLFVLLAGSLTKNAHAQNDSEQLAKDLVENEQFAKALPYFQDLVNLYPQDKELNYYLGMCLVETEQFTPQAKEALQISLGKDTPPKSFYYLGQCFHAENNFAQALDYYNQFDDKARSRVKRTTELERMIEFCEQEINPFPAPRQLEKKPETIEEESAEETGTIATEKPKDIEIPKGLKDSLINFQINSSIKYLKIDQFHNASSLQAYIQAWQAEQELNELLEKTNKLREEYNEAFAEDKETIASRILSLEKEAYQRNQTINQNYFEARQNENAFWNEASPKTIQAFTNKINAMEDSIWQAREAKRIKDMEARKPVILPDSLVKNLLPEKPVTEDKGIIYKIQIGAYSKAPPGWVQDLFKKLRVIRRIDQYTDENGVTVYTVGELKSYKDALQMQSQVRTEGVKDAFVAAYKNGERISVNEAKKITEE